MGSGGRLTTNLDATSLLLRLLEARELLYPGTTISGRHGDLGADLIRSGLLVPAGFGKFVVDHTEDDPQLVEVVVDHERGVLGYHSRFRGWIEVRRQELQRYRPDIAAIIGALLGDELRLPRQGLIEIEPDLIWEVGRIRLVKTGLTTIWLARQLSDRSVEDRLLAANARLPAGARRLILTSTPRDRVRHALRLVGSTLIPLEDVLSGYKPLSIDTATLRARFAGRISALVSEPLHLSDDGDTLTILGTEIVFSGTLQRRAMRIIVNAHGSGRGVNATQTLVEAGYGPGVRLFGQAFKKQWPVLKQFLKSRDELWRFELGER